MPPIAPTPGDIACRSVEDTSFLIGALLVRSDTPSVFHEQDAGGCIPGVPSGSLDRLIGNRWTAWRGNRDRPAPRSFTTARRMPASRDVVQRGDGRIPAAGDVEREIRAQCLIQRDS